ncbi:hypothetical protein NQ315_007243 [Exocentrus adspersus]|uniref:Uncharacterized protein n=1 Tax=Exocentrus adspersus TaxID=1586481 RepID=A0AAV8WFE3_9CUCU|nr:hypothetical protein NQ315_007243 [Exocentrus adspersus]
MSITSRMDVQEVNPSNIQELITERDACLAPSLNDVDHLAQLVNNMKLCTKYLQTYHVSKVDQELLQHLMPVIRKCILKVYEDNILLCDTVNDEFVNQILKQNLEVALDLVQILKHVLDFLVQNSEIPLRYLNSTPVTLAQLILCTYEHCKNSGDSYKQAFSVELLELFRRTQGVHLLFLRLFESIVVIQSELGDADDEEVKFLMEDTVCNTSVILSELNMKSMFDNWKGYAAIAQKFSFLLKSDLDLKSPITYLGYEVTKNLSTIEKQEHVDVKAASQLVKITAFLVKITLKICDIFWNSLERISDEILGFCCTVYSFPTDLFRRHGFPSEILELIDASIFKTTESLLTRLLSDPLSLKVFHLDPYPDTHPFGLVNVLNNVLRILVSNSNAQQLRVDVIVNAVFENADLCSAELFHDSAPMRGFFDSLVINISAAVISYGSYYEKVERILLKNLLQGRIFVVLLALEVWTLLLTHSSSQFRLDTLTALLGKYKEANFGTLSTRPEQVYLKCFARRIFRLLPDHARNDFVLRYNPVRSMEYWRVLGFGNFPPQQRLSVEGVCMVTVEKIEAMRSGGGAGFQDIVLVAENLRALSTVDYNETGLNPSKLAAAVYTLWEFDASGGDIARNNIFKYFTAALCKITGALVREFNSKQLIKILSQLKTVSANECYRLHTSEFLSLLVHRPDERNAQDNLKVKALVSDLLSQCLQTDSCNVIKQTALEVVSEFNKDGAVQTIPRLSKETQGEITDFLQRRVRVTPFDKEYLAWLGKSEFRHACLQWKSDGCQRKSKKLKYDETSEQKTELYPLEKKTKNANWCKASELVKVENKNDVDDVLSNLKGEVKCLVKLLKTEKLTAKNASDVKMIANQLLSFL